MKDIMFDTHIRTHIRTQNKINEEMCNTKKNVISRLHLILQNSKI